MMNNKFFSLAVLSVIAFFAMHDSVLPSAQVSAAGSPSCGYGCAAGYFFSNCTSSCVACSPGFYCRGNLTSPAPCKAGTYSTASAAKNNKTCVKCSAGTYSQAGSTGCTACPNLYKPTTDNSGCVKCPGGYIVSGGVCTLCPKGTYASNTTGTCVACTSGFSCTTRTMDKEKACVSGTYSDTGDGFCRPCEAGFACPATAIQCSAAAVRNKVACPAGTYATGNATACTSCPPMYYCPDPRRNTSLPCPVGFYSTGGAQNCSICPTGFVCNNTVTGFPLQCPAGTSPSSTNSNCSVCPAGYSCGAGSQTLCAIGTYSSAGALTCQPCPAGYACPNPAAGPTLCGVGNYSAGGTVIACSICNASGTQAVYQNTTGATGCSVCPIGYQCNPAAQSPTPCALGTFADVAGLFFCKSCAATSPSVATYTPSTGMSSCTPCPAGFMCPNALAAVACSSGWYSLGGAFNCSMCPAGFACPTASAVPVACGAGTYSLGARTDCIQCPANNMCPSTNVGPTPCDQANGFFAPVGSTLCSACPAGASCAFNASSGNVTYQACSSGFYRVFGQSTCRICPPGKMCPTTDYAPIPCSHGQYSMPGSTSCYVCPAGKQCNNQTAPTSCALGWYSYSGDGYCQRCQAGHACPNPWSIPVPCLPGTYSEGGRTNCTACPRGWECPSTYSFLGTARPCQRGSYSKGYQTECTICPAGSYCPSTFHAYVIPCAPGTYSSIGYANCTICPAGWACPGTNIDLNPRYQCPYGQYSTGRQTVCTVCPAGSACPSQTAAIVNTCPNGTFTAPGQGACTSCAAGYYCPLTAVLSSQPMFGVVGIGRQVPCGPGQYAPPGSFSCYDCPSGYICTSATASNGNAAPCPYGSYTARGTTFVTSAATNCVTCPTGSDCTNPTAAPSSCGVGTYASATGCKNCPAGYMCPSASVPPIPCPAGQYSTNGSIACSNCNPGYVCDPASTTPTPSAGPCPLGSYCPSGTTVAILCPAGTYGAITKGTSAGTACTQCQAGYYCPAGTAGTASQIPCPNGHYCPSGSPFATPCTSGTYSGSFKAVARATCVICPEGFFCPTGTSQYSANACPPGYYCPAGTASGFENACPVGTYGSDLRMTSASQCQQCPAGYNCPTTGLTAAVPCSAGTYQPEPGSMFCKPCEEGWACPRVAMTTYLSTPCAAGHYCPKGTALAASTACPAGTYTFRTNLGSAGDCEICWRGHACPAGTGLSPAVPQPCSAGFYCPGVPSNANGKYFYASQYSGLTTGAPNQYPCPPGTYSTLTDLWAPEQCTPCPPGSYCLGGSNAVSGTCSAAYFCPPSSYLPTQVPCPAGTYNPSTGRATQADCLACPPGKYCLVGVSAPQNCPAGSYSPYNNTVGPGPSALLTSAQCLLCPAGYYCAAGSANPTACTAGQYSGPGVGGCFTCDAGRYCPTTAVAQDQKDRLFLCPAGLYCPAALNHIPTAENEPCPIGYYCPLGVASPVPCPPSTYNPTKGRGSVTDCVLCTPGYFCSVSGATNVTGECDPGYYCPAGSTAPSQVPCPARYYRSSTRGESEDFCSVCPRGSYCPQGSAIPTPCPRGYYCVTGSDTPQPCPIGSYGNATGLRSQDECSACTAGYYCDGLGLPHPTGLCDPGYYCISRAFTSAPPGLPTGGLCPKGGYCPPGSSFPTACAEGSFNNFTGGSTQQDCTSCTPGFYCSGSNLPYPTGPCSAGYYCTGGASLPTQFRTPAGHFTLPGAPAPEECPLGTFNPSPAQGACLPCIAGYYCPTRAMVNYLPCPPGGYCAAASVLPKACPIGTYQPETRRQNSSNCLPCPPGHYCADTNASSPTGPCAPGFYCRRGCINPQCSQYSLNGGIANNNPVNPDVENNIGGECPLGFFCPNTTANPVPCPAGMQRDSRQGSSVASCGPCIPGFYCPNTGMASALAPPKKPLACKTGYYCPGQVPGETYGCSDEICSTFKNEVCALNTIGCWNPSTNVDLAQTSTAPRLCPTGFYCPGGTAAPIICPVMPAPASKRTYAPIRGLSSCSVCPGGYWCDQADVKSLQVPNVCPAGRYCPSGTGPVQPLCPFGSWSDRINLENRTQCKRCPAGRYCPFDGIPAIFTNQMPFCFGGYYCTSGAINGFGGVGVLKGVGGICPVGHYCPNGTKYNTSYPCPPGTYKPTTGGSSVGACLPCTAGFYCQGSGLSAVSGQCAPGYYCPRSCSDKFCTNKQCTAGILPSTPTNFPGGPCLKGYFCPLGSILPTMCPYGTFQAFQASPTCTDCPSGYYCGRGEYSPFECRRGHYCPPKTSVLKQPQCPPGTYNNIARATNLTHCRPCPAGEYCPQFAMNKSAGLCEAGYYCSTGAISAIGKLGTQGGDAGPCPIGHYCPKGTKYNTSFPCPPGTYNAMTRARNITGCVACTPGYYCAGWGNNKVSGPCASGYYCPTACQDAQCSNKPCKGNCAHPTPYNGKNSYAAGGICPSGHRCPQVTIAAVTRGATAPTMCLPGSYAPDSGQSVCYSCPAGRWCGYRAQSPLQCPTGYYCPRGTTAPNKFPCPPGTFAPFYNNTNYTNCGLCSPGQYCGNRGMNKTTGLCLAGFYCTSGAATPNAKLGERGGLAGICPAGYYCPAGTKSATENPCLAGTYNPVTGRTNRTACLPCTAGFYCPNSAMTSVSLVCRPGYYCPRGCADDTCSNMPCKSNCADNVNSPYLSGGLCPAGHICPGSTTRGQVLPSPCPVGTYAPYQGMVSCLPCPPGFFCSARTVTPSPCPLGHYCPIGTKLTLPNCPRGSYGFKTGGRNLTDCTRCPPGKYCAANGNSSFSGLCFPGYFCESGAVDGRGKVGALGGYGGPCPPGYYCPAGTMNGRQFPCPPGTYNPKFFGTNASACIRCRPGYYCGSSGQANVSAPCLAGYSCPAGCSDDKCANLCTTNCTIGRGGPCPRGYYCPTTTTAPAIATVTGFTTAIGNFKPIACPAGQYTPGVGFSVCQPCLAGYYCLSGSVWNRPIPCPAGSYCPRKTGATQPRCPPGTFSNLRNLNSSKECALCTPGRFCGSSGLTAPQGICAQGFFCPGGAIDAFGRTGTMGYVPTVFPRDSNNRQACPLGYFCIAGSTAPQACQPGTYNNQLWGTNRTVSCKQCPAGKYCEGSALTQPTGPCIAGFYCTQGCIDKRCYTSVTRGPKGGLCTAGHYCPNASSTPTPCAPGFYTALVGQKTCKLCPIGYYCAQGTSVPTPCPQGRYCPTGTTDTTIPQCPAGSYSNRTGLQNRTACSKCLPGLACTTTGLTAPDAQCSAGYYCNSGAATATAALGVLGGQAGPCPSGSYCLTASGAPSQCLAGTFNPTGLGTSASSCRPCTAGFYCATNGLSGVTGPCNAGFYCVAGQSDPTPSGGSCPTGRYCPQGSSYPLTCPGGTYNNMNNMTSLAGCLSCQPGSYCIPGSSLPTGPCSPGYFCVGGNNHSKPQNGKCQPGYYCPSGATEPVNCTAGKYCGAQLLSMPQGGCSAGFYCTARATTPTPVDGVTGNECPKGYYCMKNASQPVACPPGTFNPVLRGTSTAACLRCPPGKYCPSSATIKPTLNCTAGYYCPAGQRTGTPPEFICPKGSYCPAGVGVPLRCDPGTYQPLTGKSRCIVCPASYYCSPKTLCAGQNYSAPVICPTGRYCPAGTKYADEFLCPAGRYSNLTGLASSGQCIPCDPGRYCALPGTTSVASTTCTAGYYCSGGASSPTPTDNVTGNVCPAGSYCPTASSQPTPCPVGTYSPNVGLTVVTQCITCKPGRYCASPGATTDSGACDAGTYCPLGSTTPNAVACPYGAVCPAASGAPNRCPSGSYSINVNQTVCQPCPAGKFCDHTKPCKSWGQGGFNYTCPRDCPAGYYCPAGTRIANQYPCPVGRFGPSAGLPSLSHCTKCPLGQYCPYAGQSAISALYCAPGFFCFNASSVPAPTDGVTGKRCPAGHYCPAGATRLYKCPAGTYNPNTEAWNITACVPCTPGKACTMPGLASPDGTCQAGFYCPKGQIVTNPAAYVCPLGMTCPTGSSSPIHCPRGYYTRIVGQTSCLPCPAGYYCNVRDLCPCGNFTAPKLCPAGYYCPPATETAQQFPCPTGTYSTGIGLKYKANCTKCPAGKACTSVGLTTALPDCAAGYHCIHGAGVANPRDNITGRLCPPGHYCPAGTPSPVPCPTGTFYSGVGIRQASDCKLCTAGYYCGSTGLTAPTGPCSAGFYCPINQSVPNPSAYPCPGGKYCPIGTAVPGIDCAPGSYVDIGTTGKATCDSCPATFFCNLQQQALYNVSATYVVPVTCPMGYYCPTNTNSATQWPCPAGTYSNVTGRHHISLCTPCTPGRYCLNPGATSETGICAAGYYCDQGSNSSEPTLPYVQPSQGGLCPQGRYCPFGSGAGRGIPCPQGTFFSGRGARNVSACNPCFAGYYCNNATGSISGFGEGQCSAGYYCPGGDRTPANPKYICKAGTYCGIGTASPIPCQGGYYNPSQGQSSCQTCPTSFYCPRGSVTPKTCFDRHVCPGTTAYPLICPNGTYALAGAAAMASFSQCALCPSGRYCTNGTVTGPCAAGYYCQYGNSQPDPSTATDTIGVKKGGLCPIGHYCPEGTSEKRPCTNQTVGFTLGLQRATECSPCRPGYYCIETSVIPIDCPKGYYCPGYVGRTVGLLPCPRGTYNPLILATDISYCLPCKQGYYCPLEGMTSSTLFPTPPGFFSSVGQSEPYSCPAGTYSAKGNGTAANASACLTCPVGHYCGPSSATFNISCPQGTFCPTGAAYPFHCPGGHYCPRNAPEPIGCPEGFYCPPLSIFPLLCWNGTYCPSKTEVPLLCPDGYVSRNDTALRTAVTEACQACPAGTWSSNTLYCEPCAAGYVCLGATPVAQPTNVTTQNGYICPIGNYCPTGSSAPTQCPAGRFNNRTGGRTISACLNCESGFYNPDYGMSTCRRCGKSSTSTPGSASCKCLGQYRDFQPDDGSCRCIPRYVFYTDGQRLSEEDSEFSCQPIIYQRCPSGQYRSAPGTCVDAANEVVCDVCPGKKGTVDPQIGICSCSQIQSEDEVCNERCVSESNKMSIDATTNELVLRNPTTGAEIRQRLDDAAALGKMKPKTGSTQADVQMMRMDPDGPKGVFNPTTSAFLKVSNSDSPHKIMEARRQLLQTTEAPSTAENPRVITNPIVCLNLGDAMFWDVSHPSREQYPVYLKDNLLNTNSDFDYYAFRNLAEKIRAPNLTITSFIFVFDQAGVYVFANNANRYQTTIIRVVTLNERCPERRYMAVTQGSLVSMGVDREGDIILAPDWVLIGVLMAGLFLLVAGTIAGLWHFRRQTWGMVGSALPRYRNLGMQLLTGGDLSKLASKGTHIRRQQLTATGEERTAVPPGSSRVVTLRLDVPLKEFDPSEFIGIVAEEAGVPAENVLVLSVTEGSTIVRFVITGCDNAQDAANLLINRITETTNEIHTKLPILAFDASNETELAQSQHPAFSLAQLEDEFWDYERQIDLEGFNVRTLYDKLEDQTIHIVSQLTNQRDDLLLLCDKILVETEALKDMFLKVKLDIDDRSRKEREILEIRDQKLKDGHVEFDLPEDLKHTLLHFLDDFFQRNLALMNGMMSNMQQTNVNQQTTTIHETQVVRVIEEENPIIITQDNRTRKAGQPLTGNITVTGGNGRVPAGLLHGHAGPAAEPIVPAEMANMKGFNDMFAEPTTAEAASVATGVKFAMLREAEPNEFPKELRDDSDLEDSERSARSKQREQLLRTRLRRARRAADRVTMPPGLAITEAKPGVATEDDVKRIAKEREEWKAARRAERQAIDDTPAELKENPSMTVAEKRDAAKRREDILFRRLAKVRDALTAVDVPASLVDDPALPPAEREARRTKRENYLRQKIDKTRRARAETLIPMSMEDDDRVGDAQRKRIRDALEEKVGEIMVKSALVPDLPPADQPGIPGAQQENRRQAADAVFTQRIGAARDALESLDIAENASDRSDVETKEADRRRVERETILTKAGRGAGASPAGKGKKGPISATATTSVSLQKSQIANLAAKVLGKTAAESGSEKKEMPDEYRDDPDLDEEERTRRRALANAFAAGKAAGANPELPENDEAPGLTPVERRRRQDINEAFKRGAMSKGGADPLVLAKTAERIASNVEELAKTGDRQVKGALEQGKAKEQALAIPAEYVNNTSAQGAALRQAFVAGKQRETVMSLPDELLEAPELTAEERRNRRQMAGLFEKGKHADDEVRAPAEVAGNARLQDAFTLGRHVQRAKENVELQDALEELGMSDEAKELRDAFRKGQTLGALALPPRDMTDAAQREAYQAAVVGKEPTPAQKSNPAIMAAFVKGKEARASMGIPEEMRDDNGMLPQEEITHRRQLIGQFKQGLLASKANHMIDELERDTTLSEDQRRSIRTAFEAGSKAQKAADALPKELEESPTMSEGQKEMLALQRIAYVRGKAAAHLSAAIVDSMVQELPVEAAERSSALQAVEKGAAAQRSFDEVPTELRDDPALPADERKRREKLREALDAGKHAVAAKQLKSLTSSAGPSELATEATLATEKSSAITDDINGQFIRIKKEHAVACRQLKEKHSLEMTSAMEELEEENIERAKQINDEMVELCNSERKRLQERHSIELLKADPKTHDDLKRRQADEMQQLIRSQEDAKQEAQRQLVARANEKKNRIKTILEQAALNEMRLQKTLYTNQEQEIKALVEAAQSAAAQGATTREEELKRQKDILLKRLEARDKRLRAKGLKEKEFLEVQLQETAALEREHVERAAKDKEILLVARANELARKGLIEPKELDAEVARVKKQLTVAKENELAKLETEQHAERIAQQKALSEKQAKERAKELDSAKEDVDHLLQQQREAQLASAAAGTGAAGAGGAPEPQLAAGAQKALAVLVQAQEQRKQLQEQQVPLAGEEKAKDDAAKEIARLEKEKGQALTERQKKQILEECLRNEQQLKSAMTAEQRKQADDARKRLEEKRKRREAELNKKQLEDMQAEIARQEQVQREKEAALKPKLGAAVELAPSFDAEKREMEERARRELEAMKRKHDEEKRQLEAALAAEVQKQAGREMQKVNADNQRRMLELMSEQSAREAMAMNEDQRTALLRQHEKETRELQSKLDADAANQRERINQQLEAKKAKRKAELERKQKDDLTNATLAAEDQKLQFVRTAKMEVEKKIIDDAIKKGVKGENAQDVAMVVMADRHREEVSALARRQQLRRQAELSRLDASKDNKLDALQQATEAEIEKDLLGVPAGPGRDAAVSEIRTQGKVKLTQRMAEMQAKIEEERLGALDHMELEFAEEQLQLKVQHWNEVSVACGMASPDQIIRKLQDGAKRVAGEAEKELLAFRSAKQAEQEQLTEKLAKEKAEYEAKLTAEYARQKAQQEEELARKEREMMQKLSAEKEQRERRLREARISSTNNPEQAKALEAKILEEYRADEERYRQNMTQEKSKQQQALLEAMRKKNERREAKREAVERTLKAVESTDQPQQVAQDVRDVLRTAAASAAVPSETKTTVTTSSQQQQSSTTTQQQQRPGQFTMSAAMTGQAMGAPAMPMSGAAHDQWVQSVIAQLQNSPLMERIVRIETMMNSQVRHGMLSYYVDAKDRQQIKNEGTLATVEVNDLPTQQYVVYHFAQALRENIRKTGVVLPEVKIQIAKTLPESTTHSTTAFRNSYHYNHAARTLHIRNTRLNNIGEFCVVMVHALAHIKACLTEGRHDFVGFNDADPGFLHEFYGLLELCTEEMFFMRLNPAKARREAPRENRAYRLDSIMAPESLSELEQMMRKMSKSERETFVKTYFSLA